jgi:hypothetical protein
MTPSFASALSVPGSMYPNAFTYAMIGLPSLSANLRSAVATPLSFDGRAGERKGRKRKNPPQ